ncbi:MAG: carboxypeptidase-like regulatory domain-containing protein [Crocinitomicaceae bacterium]|nr:carboxypeptidase-like regulatory domain-containing protein [Crocinitomicaceae bacterium]
MKILYACLLFVFTTTTINAQVLKGVISDRLGSPIPFSKVWVQNTSYGTISNGKGEYQLELIETGAYTIRFSASGYLNTTDTIDIQKGVTMYDVVLTESIQMIQEVSVKAVNKKTRGKKIMKKVIDKRKSFLEATDKYTCLTYCFSSLDKRNPTPNDSIPDSTGITLEKMNITEWYGTSYFMARNRYKDVITGFTDYSDKANNTVTVSVSFSEDDFGEPGGIEMNPYVFVNGLEEADINIFKNAVDAPAFTQRPIISPLAYNAFVYYNFYLESSFYEKGQKIYEIRVEPKFKEEALFYGTLYIQDVSMAPVSYELGINKGALNYFKDMRIICDYSTIEGKHLPVRREFVYLIKEGKTLINGNIRVSHSDYQFEYDDDKRNFWLETKVYTPEAFDRDTSYWRTIRPFHLEEEEKKFIWEQDSITAHEQSEGYLKKQDSIYNTLTVWDFLFNGVGFRNTFKKQEIWIAGLIEQVVPFGVGGYRHTLHGSYTKEFENAHALDIEPRLDYGFNNKDLKGGLEVGYTYNPRRFSRISLRFGDTYDFVNDNESIQGTLSPANRVRNQKAEIFHQFEMFNGLYLRTGVIYSNRKSIDDLTYPDWVNVFGNFSEPKPFENYAIFMTEVELSYRFRQKYIFRGNKKIVTGTRWPMLALKFRKGFPDVFGGQSDFDYVELGLKDDIDLNSLGHTGVEFSAGSFVRKKELRIIENKYFRTSDLFFFSNPRESMQMLDTALNTSNTYLQTNFIHHFNGFFLNKVWLINKLKLEETVGGGLLMIPEANFNQVEFYVGLERMFRIKKQLFKIGFYAVASDNNFDKASIRYKFGVNFYDSFRKKWEY